MQINNPVPPTQDVTIIGQPIATNATIQNASIATDATIQNASIDTNATVQNFPATQDVSVSNTPVVNVNAYDVGETSYQALECQYQPLDALSNAARFLFGVAAGYGYNGTSWDRLRTPNVFKSVYAGGVGPITIWTPASGKKFRLMGLEVVASPDLYSTSAQDVPLTLTDGSGGSGIFSFVFYIPASSSPSMGQQRFGPYLLGNGYLSTTANNALVAAYTATPSSGYFTLNAWGTEE